jgi:hypothetical protein
MAGSLPRAHAGSLNGRDGGLKLPALDPPHAFLRGRRSDPEIVRIMAFGYIGPCLLWSFISRNASDQGDPDAPTGVSGHGVSAVPHT